MDLGYSHIGDTLTADDFVVVNLLVLVLVVVILLEGVCLV